MPGVRYLSDCLKPIDSKRQKGYNDDDLPPPFKCPKSFVEVPHELLGTDGFPQSKHWLNPLCQPFGSGKMAQEYKKAKIAKEAVAKAEKEKVETELHSVLGKGDIGDLEGKPELGVADQLDNGKTRQRAPASLPSLYDLEVGREASIVPVPGKVRCARKPRHLKRATKATHERRTDLSAVGENNKDGKSFKREFRRFDDPVLPIHDYERTMDIVSNLYYIYDRGHGQFVDRKSQKLICTYQFEDLETMKPEIRQEHQQDVETVMMATQLFQRMPTPRASGAKTSKSIILEKTSTSNDKPNSPVEPSVEHVHNHESPVKERLVNPVPNNESTLKEVATCDPISPISRTPNVYEVPIEIADLLSAYRTYLNDGEDSPLTSLPSSDTEDNNPMNGGLPIKSLKHELELIVTNTRPLNDGLSSPLTSLGNSDIDDSPPPITKAAIEEPSKKSKRQVTTNGALIQGKMYCFGCRAGFKRDVLYSPYIPCDSASHSLYKVFISELPIYGEHAGARYKTFADNAFSTTRSQLETLRVPSMTAVSKDQP
ncbi:uncharacterized protein MELLADRAFT_93887 [Melampsora larici-populina 98AG31]|uniref:Uncharacterized protein n=1 Tax=Melampsora larici-populina (strain 98AG31 / pathotype 3-4-7) TaxID=747676 RepID=F4S5M2_MELLP|nr:uncharacterized protein MELLADRAFT_93887 [Melampsora larici-populina 98AG31]EGG00084.1 hypothetical protein MELLADRAFT_93887 [Melampsora larici-populina 98AG31]